MTVCDTCLLTGGLGFLGGHVAADLAGRGRTVVVLDRVANAGGRRADLICDLALGKPDMSECRPQSVYHLAGLAHVVPRTREQVERFNTVNVAGAERLLKGLEASGHLPESFVLVSTVAVYGVEGGENLDENTHRGATDPYGESKRRQEDLVGDWCSSRGLRLTIVRLPLVVGAGAPGNFGAMVNGIRRGRYLGIGRGDARRSMVAVGDVAAALPVAERLGGTYHLTDGEHPSFRELETAICAGLDRSNPMRLPMVVARCLGLCGDLAAAVTGRSMPFSSRTLGKMTSTLTFDDAAARRAFGWAPASVIGRMREFVAP